MSSSSRYSIPSTSRVAWRIEARMIAPESTTVPSRSKRTTGNRTTVRWYRRARSRRLPLPRRPAHALGPRVVCAVRGVPAPARHGRRRGARRARGRRVVPFLHARRPGDRARGLPRAPAGAGGAPAGAARGRAARGRPVVRAARRAARRRRAARAQPAAGPPRLPSLRRRALRRRLPARQLRPSGAAAAAARGLRHRDVPLLARARRRARRRRRRLPLARRPSRGRRVPAAAALRQLRAAEHGRGGGRPGRGDRRALRGPPRAGRMRRDRPRQRLRPPAGAAAAARPVRGARAAARVDDDDRPVLRLRAAARRAARSRGRARRQQAPEPPAGRELGAALPEAGERAGRAAAARRRDGLLVLEDEPDAGDLYTFCPGGPVRRARFLGARVVRDDGLVRDLLLEHELPGIRVETVARTVRGLARIELRTTVENEATDHRLRVGFPVEPAGSAVRAECQFAVVRRPLEPAPPRAAWVEPPVATAATLGAVALGPLVLLTKGLPEYEADRDGLRLTLLRCVGTISRPAGLPTRPLAAGPDLPTPEGQCLGKHVLEYALRPDADGLSDAVLIRAGQDYRTDFLAGDPFEPPLELDGDVVFSCLKGAEDGDGLVLRLFNPSASPERAAVRGASVSRLRLDEEVELGPVAGELELAPWE